MGKQVLVVGGAGYIGSHVNKKLNESGFQTLIIDNLSRGFKESCRESPLITGDLGDERLLEELFQEHSIEAVLHFAALINVGESVNEPRLYYDNNVSKTLRLLDAMRRHNVKIFIFSSSAAIFGNPQTDRIKEDHPKSPINPYGRTKLMVEEILDDYEVAYGLKSSALRYFNAAGADPSGSWTDRSATPQNLIPIVLRRLREGKPLQIYGDDYPTPDGSCLRDYIHVDDLATAHILALEKLLKGGASTRYNLGNEEGISVKEVIKAAQTITGIEGRVEVCPRRPGDPAVLIADSTRARNELLWQPQRSTLEVIVEDAWRAMR